MRLFEVRPGDHINLDQVASVREIQASQRSNTNPRGLVAWITMSSQETFYLANDALDRLMRAIAQE
jgi:hypothetical protein